MHLPIGSIRDWRIDDAGVRYFEVPYSQAGLRSASWMSYLRSTMSFTVKLNKKNEYVVTIGGPITDAVLVRLTSYLRILELTKESTASPKDVRSLADTVDTDMWRKRRQRMAS